MSDLRGKLDREARRVRPDEGALDLVRRRAQRRRVARRAGASLLALAIAAGGLGLAYGTFRPANDAGPAVGPTPGPTPTGDDATPPPVTVEIYDATATEGTLHYARSLLETQGRGRAHGGYRVLAITETEGSEVTVLYCDPRYDAEAARLRDLFFPDAEIRLQVPDDPVQVRIVLGEDFAVRHTEAIDAFGFVNEFGAARSEGERADLYLGTDAATYYHGDEDGSLYGYAKGCPYEVEVGEEPGSPDIARGSADEFLLFFCRNNASSWTERVRVGTEDGEQRIVEAALVVVTTSG